MQTIDTHSRAIIEFTLNWQDGGISHHDSYWADPVSFWRDILPPKLVQGLLRQSSGGSAAIDIPAASFLQPYDPSRRLLLHPDQFRGSAPFGNFIPLVPGRYYPQGLLTGVDGVFRVSTAPCRYLGREGDRLAFDLNHPLAGRDLALQATIRAIHHDQKERGGRCEDWLERISANGPGMQTILRGAEGQLLAEENFRRLDERPDVDFYRQARLVQHLDSFARQEISRKYGSLIPTTARVLDLMASWDSHLPAGLDIANLTLLGMNEEELRQNSRANVSKLHDLNREKELPFAAAAFDAVICTASVEYLTKPLEVLREIRRVLRPGGLLAIAFSNRWFPSKAIHIWQELHEFERLGLVVGLLQAAGGFTDLTTLSRRGLPRPDDDPHPEIPFSDPVYMVWGKTIQKNN